MTALGRWLRRLAERWLGRYHEGPEPPERLGWLARQFALLHPGATREDWEGFAGELAAEAYRIGYVRGWEHAERTDEWRPDVPPEVAAAWMDPGWRDGGNVPLEPGAVPGEDETEEQAMARTVDEAAIAAAREG